MNVGTQRIFIIHFLYAQYNVSCYIAYYKHFAYEEMIMF